MRGSRVAKLKREALSIGATRRGWRKLKRAWTTTPRPERRDFDAVVALFRLQWWDPAKLKAWLGKQPQHILERLHKTLTESK